MTTVTATPLNDKRTINAWAFFDWANSAYALVISAAVFPGYYMKVTDDFISIGDWRISNSVLYAYAISFAYLIMALISPLLSGIADYSGRRMMFLKFFTSLGALACISLFFFTGMSELFIGTIGFVLATIGFTGGLVFYNSYLPLIVTEDRYDKVSAKGFSYGYVGSVILLIMNLIIILNPSWFGIPADSSLGIRVGFVMVGLWWIGFAQIPFRRLPQDSKKIIHTNDVLTKGYRELLNVWNNIKHQPYIKRFLLSFFAYSAGVQTTLYLAATFAEKELHFETSELIILILVLQLVGIGGAHLFAQFSKMRGNKQAIIIMLMIWIIICILAYLIYTKIHFYMLAAGVGLVMGGIQSLSRSTYSKLLPETKDITTYFSFYDVLEKFAIVIGTFSFGIIEQITGSMRVSALALVIFFLIGLFLIMRVTVVRSTVQFKRNLITE
ncbi:MAG: MFS transporter [Saprospiraceae bacterium]|nr:MFS transporter [Saprospiraceae bacterium]MBP7680227.1 MFS transporter [Saprospiraceae bacterium]